MSDKFQSEFKRVFGSVNTDGDGVFADEWPGAVRFNEEKAFNVLRQYRDGFGETELGDATVCAALEKAGAVIG